MGRSHVGVALGAAALSVVFTLWRPSILADADLRVYDALVRSDGADADPSVHSAIVSINEASLERLGQWPWHRDVLARLVDRLQALGASAIAFDVLFAESDRAGASFDDRFAEALARAPSVTGFAFVFDQQDGPGACTLHLLELVERQRGDSLPTAGVLEASGRLCSIDALTAAAGASGFINAAADPDGLLRRVPLLLRWDGRVYPSLALAAVRRATGGGTVVLDARDDGSMALTVGTRTVGLDARGRLLVRHAHPVAARAPISAADVLEGTVDAQRIRGRVVFVGATAMGLRDVVTTARDRALPAVADTLMGGAAYERPPSAALLEIAAALFSVLLVAVVVARAGLIVGAVAGLGLSGLAWWLARTALESQGWFVSPLWAGGSVAITLLLEGGAMAYWERRRADRERRSRADAQRLIVQSLTTLTEIRDADTGRHARRTQEGTRVLATALARHAAYRHVLTPDRITLISTLAPLHDIGKIGISDSVLRKPGALTPVEHAEMRRHPELGYETLLKAEMLAGVHNDDVIGLAKEIVYTHHERWDGTGYPRGLRGDAIPVSGRLVALVDAYDALVADRAYRDGVSHEAAIVAIQAGRGQHFDPDVVDAFLSVHEQFRQARVPTSGGAYRLPTSP